MERRRGAGATSTAMTALSIPAPPSGINPLVRSSMPSPVAGDFDDDMRSQHLLRRCHRPTSTPPPTSRTSSSERGNGSFVVDPLAGGANGPGRLQSPPDMVSGQTTTSTAVSTSCYLFQDGGQHGSLYRNAERQPLARDRPRRRPREPGRHQRESAECPPAARRSRGENGGVHSEFGQTHQRLFSFGLGGEQTVQELRVHLATAGRTTVIDEVSGGSADAHHPAGARSARWRPRSSGSIIASGRSPHPRLRRCRWCSSADRKHGPDYAISRIVSVVVDRFAVHLQKAENLTASTPTGRTWLPCPQRGASSPRAARSWNR